MNYPPIYLCDTLAFNLNELIMQDFANAVETVSKMKDLSSCRVFLVNSAAFHKYERHCHTFIFSVLLGIWGPAQLNDFTNTKASLSTELATFGIAPTRILFA